VGLQKIRKERGLTIEHLAVLGGCDKSTISRWERGLQTPSAELVVRISKALKVSPDRLADARSES